MLQVTFSVSLLPDSGWPQLFLLPDLTFCSFFLGGGDVRTHAHVHAHVCTSVEATGCLCPDSPGIAGIRCCAQLCVGGLGI